MTPAETRELNWALRILSVASLYETGQDALADQLMQSVSAEIDADPEGNNSAESFEAVCKIADKIAALFGSASSKDRTAAERARRYRQRRRQSLSTTTQESDADLRPPQGGDPGANPTEHRVTPTRER